MRGLSAAGDGPGRNPPARAKRDHLVDAGDRRDPPAWHRQSARPPDHRGLASEGNRQCQGYEEGARQAATDKISAAQAKQLLQALQAVRADAAFAQLGHDTTALVLDLLVDFPDVTAQSAQPTSAVVMKKEYPQATPTASTSRPTAKNRLHESAKGTEGTTARRHLHRRIRRRSVARVMSDQYLARQLRWVAKLPKHRRIRSYVRYGAAPERAQYPSRSGGRPERQKSSAT